MTPQIKQRIEQIRRGEVPAGYKKTKVGVVPNEWEETRFKKMFSRLSRKNKENNDNVLTISAQYGLISQRDFFNKDIASDDKSNYFLLHKGEFAYNKSYSNGYPFGALKRLDMYDKGIVSPLYICFSANENNECPDFYVHYFEAGMMNREIQAFAQEGARNHGLLNISVDDFFNSYLLMPPRPEQEKIAEILSAQNKLIALKEKLVEEKKRQKKALMQQLITGKKRLPGFSEDRVSLRLKQVAERITRKNAIANNNVLTISAQYGLINQFEFFDKEIASEDKSNYYLLMQNEFAYNKSYSANYPFGAIKKLTRYDMGIVSPVYICFRIVGNEVSTEYMEHYFEAGLMNSEIQSFAQEGARNHGLLNISVEDFFQSKIVIPPYEEQIAIAKILSSIAQEIDLLQQTLEQEKRKKKALMQLLLTGIVRV